MIIDSSNLARKSRKKRVSRHILTEEQLKAVLHDGEHAIVGAVAGSGKSHLLLYRNIYLMMRKEVKPCLILNLMFNNSAAAQFRERLAPLSEKYGVGRPLVHTFHAFGMRILESMMEKGWLPEGELIEDEWRLIKMARAALEAAQQESPDGEQFDLDNEAITEFLAVIDIAKAGIIEPETPKADQFFAQYETDIYRRAFAHYENTRRANGLYTFSDFIYDPVRVLIDDPHKMDWAANRFDHIIVDEYQDVNEAQQALIRILAGQRAKVMVVGDEDQCIYEWRGAKPYYMARGFEEDFPGATRYALTRTFRYGDRISLLASQLISHNTERTPKVCVSSDSTPNSRFVLDLASDWKDQQKQIAGAVKEWLDGGRKMDEIAILVREYSQTVVVETSLMDAGIPYRLVGAPPAFARREILALRGYLALATPKGLGRLQGETLKETLHAMLQVPTLYIPGSQREALVDRLAAAPDGLADALEAYGAGLLDYQRRRFRQRAELIRNLRLCSEHPNTPVSQVMPMVISDLSLYREIHKTTPRKDVADEKVRLCQEFVEYAKSNLSVEAFLDEIEQAAERCGQDADTGVLVTSVHRAKGLEWPHVILPELSEGRFPAYDTTKKKEPPREVIEQERRLFYVAMTRAKELLTMIGPKDPALLRSLAGKSGNRPNRTQASRFLFEADIPVARRLLPMADHGETEWLLPRMKGVPGEYLKAIGHPILKNLPDGWDGEKTAEPLRVDRNEPQEPPDMTIC